MAKSSSKLRSLAGPMFEYRQPHGWDDWDLFFAKCATDERFRTKLGRAMRDKDRKEIEKLLKSAGVAGQTPAQLTERTNVLIEGFGSMVNIIQVFTGRVDAAVP